MLVSPYRVYDDTRYIDGYSPVSAAVARGIRPARSTAIFHVATALPARLYMTTLDRTASEGIARVDANKLEQRIRKLIADKCVAQGLTRAELRTPMTRDAAIRRAAELAFGHIVRELRLQRGLSLQDLAQISREEIDYLTRLEQGEAPARRETIFTLATAFNIKVQEFIHSIFSRADMILACLSALTLFGLNELSGNVTLGGERLSADQRRVRR